MEDKHMIALKQLWPELTELEKRVIVRCAQFVIEAKKIESPTDADTTEED